MRCSIHPDRIVTRSLVHCGECYSQGKVDSEITRSAHRHSRNQARLPAAVPDQGEVVCSDCGNHCRLSEGVSGFCNLRYVADGRIVKKYGEKAPVRWYFDPLPTNCVADWVCPVRDETELGFGKTRLKNLAIFYGSCNSDCLFCQNISYQDMMREGKPLMTPQELANVADDYTACACYFGGDPSCNPWHSLETSKILDEQGLRVCYETNGNISAKWLDQIADIVIKSKGTMKFDLKAVTPSLYKALTNVSNQTVINNFRKLARRGLGRENEFLVASILLVPGYVGLDEVGRIADFISYCDSSIPTALLGFYPHHLMRDLPRTSRNHAEDALALAKDSGLTNVRLGNTHLLSTAEYCYD